MPGRSYSNGSYRYGFNGKENDAETKTQDYGIRIYNPGLGRFLSVDPLSAEYPWNSTYAFAENEPISNVDLDGLEKAKSNNAVSLIGQGLRQGYQETKQKFWSIFSREGFKSTKTGLKSTANDIIGTIKGDPTAIKNFSKRVSNSSLQFSNGIQGYTSNPVLWLLNIPNRSKEENIRGIGYGAWKAGEFYVMYRLPELFEETGGFYRPSISKVDLMGGPQSSLGKGWLNFDLKAAEGIADDVANFGKHFGKNSVAEIVVNNPQAEFLQYVTEALEEGGKITVRGNLSNKYFKSIYNGKANGIDNFQMTERNPNVPNNNYKKTTGEPIQGEIHEIILKKIKKE